MKTEKIQSFLDIILNPFYTLYIRHLENSVAKKIGRKVLYGVIKPSLEDLFKDLEKGKDSSGCESDYCGNKKDDDKTIN